MPVLLYLVHNIQYSNQGAKKTMIMMLIYKNGVIVSLAKDWSEARMM